MLTPISKKSETIQFRYDPENTIKFRKICENKQISMTDQIKILIEDFSKNYIFSDELYTANIEINLGQSFNKPNCYYLELSNAIDIKIKEFDIINLQKLPNYDQLDISKIKSNIIKEISNLYFILPEFFDENNYELYRVDSFYYHRATTPYVGSTKVNRCCLSAHMKDYEWKGAIFVYSSKYWNGNDPSINCIEDIKTNLEKNVREAIVRTIDTVINQKIDTDILLENRLKKGNLFFNSDKELSNLYLYSIDEEIQNLDENELKKILKKMISLYENNMKNSFLYPNDHHQIALILEDILKIYEEYKGFFTFSRKDDKTLLQDLINEFR